MFRHQRQSKILAVFKFWRFGPKLTEKKKLVEFKFGGGIPGLFIKECCCLSLEVLEQSQFVNINWQCGAPGWGGVASFPGSARSSLAVRNSRRGPGLVHHVMCAAAVILRHTRYGRAVLQHWL